jgi:hypothetical protein
LEPICQALENTEGAMNKIQRRATGNTGRTKRKFNQNKNTTQYVSDTITRIQEKLEDTKGAIIIRISKKNRQQNVLTYCRHHDLVDRYGISVSQITTDMFHLS